MFIRPPIANLDVLFIVASTTQPVPSTLVLDKLTAAALYQNVQPVLVFTKTDLSAADTLAQDYARSGIPLVFVHYDTGRGPGCACAAGLRAGCAPSAATRVWASPHCLNTIAPELHRETGEISRKLGRGRHTTRETEIFEVCGGRIADTAGFASLETQRLCRIPKEQLEQVFPEMEPYREQCRFIGCSHRSEQKGCAVRQALEEGRISPTRYASYLAMYEEAAQLKDWELK